MCSEGEHVTETHAWDAQSAEYEAQEPEWVAEADAYCGKDDAWDESSPQDCGELDELFGSLKTAKASATTELGNASKMTSAARNVMDAGKLVAQVKSARGFFLRGWRAPWFPMARTLPGKGKGVSLSKSRALEK